MAGNPLTGEEGTVISHACGVWARLQPLKPGRHTLTLRGSSAEFHTGVEYTLMVETEQGQGATHDDEAAVAVLVR
ncbi:hypothetical protein [Nonomuraea sp. NPDC003709]|uniref:hypothetical protein n=1 Tax=Nonomuraea sp. NPDC003709 TaxID=3154450 RepID=UPI0033AB79DD